ncbi:hypothetical protein O4H49_19255 [Kiloniella laminariae]|uniref:Solute-binding protein family 3/N-terminal domain-containing protein n=1 Tax=Kiloniella laminariae TaxID=454162 RepID=A0ABT4LPC5_9PROT|nr:hypothetical protein [Kiloniella laminariae]MCZ4282929.1 hypothetical protein [Kiloniella laminariae]
MKRLYLQLSGILFVGTLFSGLAQAEGDGVCPQVLSSVSNSYLNEISKKVLKSVYAELGCPVTVLDVPGRRGILLFNNMDVDGEVLRFDIVEPQYSRKFVRSRRPMFYEDGSLWVHPDPLVRDKIPTGYVLGILWHETYMKNRRGKSYSNSNDLLRAYTDGEIGSFLYTDSAMEVKVSSHKISPIPLKGERVVRAPIYHYLGAEFTPFMRRFAKYLDQHEPFSFIEKRDENIEKAVVGTQ